MASIAILLVAALLITPAAPAQVRGVYPLGVSATNSGVTPPPGFSYSNLFLLTNIVVNGYWSGALSSGQTAFLRADRRTSLSTLEMYEVRGVQWGTGIRPGQTLDLDYIVLRAIAS